MNRKFYSDLRKIVLAARAREEIKKALSERLEKLHKDFLYTLECPRVGQPNSDNEISGPTC